MTRKKKLSVDEIIDACEQLTTDEQGLVITALMSGRSIDRPQGIRDEDWNAVASALWLAKDEEDSRVAKARESAAKPAKGKFRVRKRRALVAELKRKNGLTAHEIFDRYRDELTRLTPNAKKPITFWTVDHDYKLV